MSTSDAPQRPAQGTCAILGSNPSKDWPEFAVCWGGAVLEHGTSDLQLGAQTWSDLSSLPPISSTK